MEVDGQPLALKPGTFHPTYTRGLHTPLPEALRGRGEPLVASVDLELVGTERLSVVPLGGATDVQFQSSWPHPSFGGRFLPSERALGDDGVTARWHLSALATTAQQDVAASRRLCDLAGDPAPYQPSGTAEAGCADVFGVSFIDPVNPYSLSGRATKYGVLFIALTFLAVGLFELLQRLRVHPVQYLLAGSALCSFFLLLVSLSEHLPFGTAYAAAAGACALLLTYYACHMLRSVRRGLPFGAGIAVLYGLLYLLLQLEQTALVVGALSLFAVLAFVMVATRKLDWYALSSSRRGPSNSPRTETAA